MSEREERDVLHEECGIYGAYGCPKAAELVYIGLYALQHRGQESAGVVAYDGERVRIHKGMGLVAEVFSAEVLAGLLGHIAIGHNRYSTTGSSQLSNAQPILANFRDGHLAVAHNGDITNALALRRELEDEGSIFQSSMDTEVIVHLIARSHKPDMAARITEALAQVEGAYSLLVLWDNRLFAIRDPHGFRPLSVGTLGGGYIVTSETCALDIVQAAFLRDIEPGEILEIAPEGLVSHFPFPKSPLAQCIFEFIYFARPDSRIFGASADRARRAFGRQLAREQPAQGDCVISVPDSSNSAALGYAEESRLPLEIGLIRNHYIGRTFIHPVPAVRDFRVRVKFNPVPEVLEGRRVVIVDDSIVRGTTSRTLVRMVRQAGAREVHLRISSPPITGPCFYGIDTPTRRELIAANKSVEEIRAFLGVDSLGYLSLEGLLQAAPLPPSVFCHACFSGEYPVKVEAERDKLAHERQRTR